MKATELVKRRNEAVAFRVVTQKLLKDRPQDVERSRRLILKEWETEARLKPLIPFVESWNEWRRHYSKAETTHDWMPKTAAQLTVIENIIALCAEHNYELDIFVACGHRAWARSRYPLSLQHLAANGLDYFAKHAEDVNAELDKLAYERRALGEE